MSEVHLIRRIEGFDAAAHLGFWVCATNDAPGGGQLSDAFTGGIQTFQHLLTFVLHTFIQVVEPQCGGLQGRIEWHGLLGLRTDVLGVLDDESD